MKNVQDALRKVLVPLNHFVHRIVLLIAQDLHDGDGRDCHADGCASLLL